MKVFLICVCCELFSSAFLLRGDELVSQQVLFWTFSTESNKRTLSGVLLFIIFLHVNDPPQLRVKKLTLDRANKRINLNRGSVIEFNRKWQDKYSEYFQ